MMTSTWKNSLNYRRGDTYATVRARAMARLYRLANVGGPTATARAHELLRNLEVAKQHFQSGSRRRRSATGRSRRWWPWT